MAMANGIPVIASSTHMFDDLEGIVPLPENYVSLAEEIDKIFSSETYRKDLLKRIDNYINENNWCVTADRYIELYNDIIAN